MKWLKFRVLGYNLHEFIERLGSQKLALRDEKIWMTILWKQTQNTDLYFINYAPKVINYAPKVISVTHWFKIISSFLQDVTVERDDLIMAKQTCLWRYTLLAKFKHSRRLKLRKRLNICTTVSVLQLSLLLRVVYMVGEARFKLTDSSVVEVK